MASVHCPLESKADVEGVISVIVPQLPGLHARGEAVVVP
jgi:hypothetical protein